MKIILIALLTMSAGQAFAATQFTVPAETARKALALLIANAGNGTLKLEGDVSTDDTLSDILSFYIAPADADSRITNVCQAIDNAGLILDCELNRDTKTSEEGIEYQFSATLNADGTDVTIGNANPRVEVTRGGS